MYNKTAVTGEINYHSIHFFDVIIARAIWLIHVRFYLQPNIIILYLSVPTL